MGGGGEGNDYPLIMLIYSIFVCLGFPGLVVASACSSRTGDAVVASSRPLLFRLWPHFALNHLCCYTPVVVNP